jgi:hypothetical protein
MTLISFANPDDAIAYLPFTGMDFYFFGTNYGNSDGTNPSTSIYMSTNYAFGFGLGSIVYLNWPVSFPAILFDFFDSWNFESYVSTVLNGINGTKYVRIVAIGTDYSSGIIGDITVKKAYEILYIRDTCFQYMQFNCNVETVDRSLYPSDTTATYANGSNITNGIAFQNTFGLFSGGPQTGGSYVIRSDLNGNNWQFFSNTHLIV